MAIALINAQGVYEVQQGCVWLRATLSLSSSFTFTTPTEEWKRKVLALILTTSMPLILPGMPLILATSRPLSPHPSVQCVTRDCSNWFCECLHELQASASLARQNPSHIVVWRETIFKICTERRLRNSKRRVFEATCLHGTPKTYMTAGITMYLIMTAHTKTDQKI
jgi:hypothetical protein